MIIGIPRETCPGERRVAMVPAVLHALRKAGAEVLIESGAGSAAGFPDAEYADKGGRVAATRAEVFGVADVILQVRLLGANPACGQDDLAHFRREQVLIGLCEPLTAAENCRLAAERGVTLFAMELVPRITRAQGMDVLSSQASIAGYKAVLMAADALPRMFPMMTTAAGTIKPARVLVIGAGVAGLQAIATARRLGALVSAYDVRPAVKEQIESLGARFVTLDIQSAGAEDKGGYAKAMDEAFYRRQREELAKVIAEQDVVVTTAAVPGKRSPLLITADAVRRMSPGSVIVDLAAPGGGNCELTRAGETVVEKDVRILGPVNLPGEVPYHASEMYARNVAAFVRLIVDKSGRLNLNLGDEIVRETLATRDGEVVHARIREALGLPPLSSATAPPAAAPGAGAAMAGT